MRKFHTLKTDPEVFQESAVGLKKYEIRINDRDFEVGDHVILMETVHNGEEMENGAPLEYTGRSIGGYISHILYGPVYGLKDGWVIFSIEKAY